MNTPEPPTESPSEPWLVHVPLRFPAPPAPLVTHGDVPDDLPVHAPAPDATAPPAPAVAAVPAYTVDDEAVPQPLAGLTLAGLRAPLDGSSPASELRARAQRALYYLSCLTDQAWRGHHGTAASNERGTPLPVLGTLPRSSYAGQRWHDPATWEFGVENARLLVSLAALADDHRAIETWGVRKLDEAEVELADLRADLRELTTERDALSATHVRTLVEHETTLRERDAALREAVRERDLQAGYVETLRKALSSARAALPDDGASTYTSEPTPVGTSSGTPVVCPFAAGTRAADLWPRNAVWRYGVANAYLLLTTVDLLDVAEARLLNRETDPQPTDGRLVRRRVVAEVARREATRACVDLHGYVLDVPPAREQA